MIDSIMTTTHLTFARRILPLIAVLAASAAAAIFLAAAAPATPTAPFTLMPGSRLWLTGDSTLHPYSSNATQVDATAELDPAFAAGAADAHAAIAAGALKSLRLAVPVAGLKSGESGLDKNLARALKQEAAPVIRFTLLDYQAVAAKDGGLLVKAHGRLAIAGVEKDTVVEGTCRFDATGLAVTGAKDLLMSDFGIKPPVLMFGAIKTADKVVVHFDLKLKAPGAAATQ